MNYIITNIKILDFFNIQKTSQKKSKPLILLIYLQNINGTSFDIVESTSNYICQLLYIALFLTFFKSTLYPFDFSTLFTRLDFLLPNYKKIGKELIGEFL